MNQKSILEQALLQVETLEEAVKANAKGILASTMKRELKDLLKESMEEEEENKFPEEEEKDVTDDESGDEDTSINDEPTDDEETDGFSDDEETPEDGEFGGEDDEFPSEGDDEEDVLDMTNASDDEVLKVFKAMKPEDGIVVKKDGNKIEFSVDDNDYIIKLGDDETEGGLPDDEFGDLGGDEETDFGGEEGGEGEEVPDFGAEDEEPEFGNEDGNEFGDEEGNEEEPKFGNEDEDLDEEVVYEIELDEEDDDDKEPDNDADDKEGEVEESARTIGNGYHAGIKSKKKYYTGNKREEINEELVKLRKQNGEYKKALVLFKEKINEVAVFNANLAYATRLFTEHSTTKQEKLNILKRFDSISTITESKNLYSSIKTELGTKTPITETVANKLTITPKSSTTEMLSESKTYENPQFRRMRELMGKVK
jgi:hypothetical protein